MDDSIMKRTALATNRYERQELLPEIGTEGQHRLAQARVLIVGTGGLGSPLALYLAGAGIGRIGLADNDVVSLNNLHRQVLYAEDQLDRPKVDMAAQRLHTLNGEVKIDTYPCSITAETAGPIISRYDIVADACDNFSTRYLLSDVCAAQGKPLVHGAVRGFCGQVAVLCAHPGAKTYRDLYPDEEATLRMPPPPKGIVGMTAGVVGCVQAHEVLKLVCGHGDLLDGRLWTIDLRTMQSFVLEL